MEGPVRDVLKNGKLTPSGEIRNYSREISPGVYRAGTRSVVKLSIFTPHMTLVTLSIPLVGFTYLLRPDTQVSLVYASLSIVQCQ